MHNKKYEIGRKVYVINRNDAHWYINVTVITEEDDSCIYVHKFILSNSLTYCIRMCLNKSDEDTYWSFSKRKILKLLSKEL